MRKNLSFLFLAPLFLWSFPVYSQLGSLSVVRKASEPPSSYTWEGLELRDTVTTRPAYSETLLGTQSAFRRDLFRYGLALSLDTVQQYTQNSLAAPVSADQQAYVGQRPFEEFAEIPVLSYNLRQFHLSDAQFHMEGSFRWVSWNHAGPRSVGMSALYLYKGFDEGQVDVKAGYLLNDFEYVGLRVGGSVAAGAQGVYAVLPYEVGLSHNSQPAPSLHLKVRTPAHFYVKAGVQRSLDPGGGEANVHRNPTGFRFIPKGEKLLALTETGFQKAATPDTREIWLRGGYFHNSTPYPNKLTGREMTGNYFAYLLGDYQLLQTSADHPRQGVFIGASAMMVPASMNTYAKYFELRFYDKAPFRSRPSDMMSLLATYTVYSSDKIQALRAAGETFSRGSNSVTGSYNLHMSRGTFLSMGLSYVTGPAITPHLSNALTATLETHVFF